MRILRKLAITQRLWLMLLASLLMLLALTALLLQNSYSNLYSAKVMQTRNAVENTLGILRHFNALQVGGELSLEQAQTQAKDLIRQLRYNGDDYFFIHDLRPVMLMHPLGAKLEGADLSQLKDSNGKLFNQEMVRVARDQGGGVVPYSWPRIGQQEPVDKVSYVALFKPWGWILGTGMYIDDMQAQFREELVQVAWFSLLIALALAATIGLIVRSIALPLRATVAAMANIASGEADLTRQLPEEGHDELSALAGHFNAFTGTLRQVVGDAQGAVQALGQAADHLSQNAHTAQEQSGQQSQQMELVAAAINQMAYSVQDVAKNAEDSARAVLGAQAQSGLGLQSIDNSLEQIDQLSLTIDQAVNVIRSLAEQSTQIGGVLETIRSIAEQTNLLALNAAIEAARAGEQGRGFAVVADEVRLLAQRTQKSTAETQVMIDRLQSNMAAAVEVIDNSSRASQLTVEQSRQAGTSLNQIAETLLTLKDLAVSIASATLQQSQVVEDINQNVAKTASLAQENAQTAGQSNAASHRLDQVAEQLSGLLGQFRV